MGSQILTMRIRGRSFKGEMVYYEKRLEGNNRTGNVKLVGRKDSRIRGQGIQGVGDNTKRIWNG